MEVAAANPAVGVSQLRSISLPRDPVLWFRTFTWPFPQTGSSIRSTLMSLGPWNWSAFMSGMFSLSVATSRMLDMVKVHEQTEDESL